MTSPGSKHHAALLCWVHTIQMLMDAFQRCCHMSTVTAGGLSASAAATSRGCGRQQHHYSGRSSSPPQAAARRPRTAQVASTRAAHAQHSQRPRPFSTSDFEPAPHPQPGSAHRSSRKSGPAAALSPATPAQRPKRPDLPAAGDSSHRQRDMGPAAAPSRDHQPFIDLTGAQRRIHIDLAGS